MGNSAGYGASPQSTLRPSQYKTPSIYPAPQLGHSQTQPAPGNKNLVSTLLSNSERDRIRKMNLPGGLALATRSSKQNGPICSYAASTHTGMVRNYNEDRVTLVTNIQ